MGQVSSTVKFGSPFCVDPQKMVVLRFECLVDESGFGIYKPQISAKYDKLSENCVAEKPEMKPLGFTQDPETQQLLAQVDYSSQLLLNFQLFIDQNVSPQFVFGQSLGELNMNIESQSCWVHVESQSFRHNVNVLPNKPLYFVFLQRGEILCGGALWICEGKVQVALSPTGDTTVSHIKEEATPISATPMAYGMPLAPKRVVFSAPRPNTSLSFEPEDGPLFRTSVASMEKQVAPLKARAKILLKRSISSHQHLQQLIEADQLMAQSLQDAAKNEIPSLKPLAEWFSQKHEGGMNAIQRQRKFTLNELAIRVIEPLQQLYEFDIKSFDYRKRQFEEFSSEFYSWTSRYLSNRKENKKTRSGEPIEVKFAQKKRAFDSARYEYFSYLTDITSGLKQQILLQLFALAAQTITDSHIALGSEMDTRTRPRIDSVVADVKEAAREWENYRLDELKRKRALNTSEQETLQVEQYVSTAASLSSTSDVSTPKNYKEGLLWASNRPLNVNQDPLINKQPSLQSQKWHKYWVVVDGSSLREYSNWKQSVDLHNEPINLLIANVREAKFSERRFCFEVITPSYKRIYQATSEEDMHSWISSINKSKTSLLEASQEKSQQTLQPPQPPVERQQTPPLPHSPESNEQKIVLAGSPITSEPIPITSTPRSPLHSPVGSPSSPGTSHFRPLIKHGGSNRMESLTRRLSMKGERPGIAPIITNMGQAPAAQTNNNFQYITSPMQQSSQSANPMLLQSNEELINNIRKHPSNRVCAECNTTKGVEWVSINLLIVMCIDCSGAHRSLGSHISKVRSLTLDIGAFTPSLCAAFCAVTNESMNGIWEQRLPPNRKLVPDATSKSRVNFVTEKYVEKQFISELEKPNAALRRAISERDIPKMCAALASRANPNGVSDEDEPMIIHALRSTLPGETTFPTAEVLIKNGAHVPQPKTYSGLSEAAEAYLVARLNQP